MEPKACLSSQNLGTSGSFKNLQATQRFSLVGFTLLGLLVLDQAAGETRPTVQGDARSVAGGGNAQGKAFPGSKQGMEV